jgi:uncharacterized delta-60 repeat protein
MIKYNCKTKSINFLFIFITLLLLSYKGIAQVQNDPNFNIGTGFWGGGVGKILLQPDEKILVTGNFLTFNGASRNRIARLNVNGTLDTFFDVGTGFNNPVYTIARQSDGKIIVGGHFTSFNGTSINRLIRLNVDGSLDNSFNIGNGFNSWVNSIVIQSNGKIILGGNFQLFNGTTINNIVRLNSDGSLDTSFNIGTGFNSYISSIVSQPDGKIIVGGNFTSYNGTPINRLARLNVDGSLDPSFNISAGFTESNSWLYSIVLQSDGKIVVGGSFTAFNGTSVNRIVRLNADGSLDTSFNIGTGFNSYVNSIVIQPNGKILIGGDFTSYNGTSVNRIVRLNTNCTLDVTFFTGSGFDAWVHSIVPQTDGKILVGGNFTTYDGIAGNGVARIRPCIDVTGVDTQVSCGSYIWIDGVEYFESNDTATFTIVGGAASGCDSLVTLNLTINQPNSSSFTLEACSSYSWNGNTYVSSGTYTENFTNVNGCDSIATLNLTVNVSPMTPIVIISNDTTLSTIPQTGVQYQWINCDTWLPLANQTDTLLHISENGNYAVIVSNSCGSDTSNCVLSTNSIFENQENYVLVYPNPTSEKAYLEVLANLIGRVYQITDFTGKLIQTDIIKETNQELNLKDVSTGVYFISIENQAKKVKINKL